MWVLAYTFVCKCRFQVELRGQLAGISSLLPPRESQESNSGRTACGRAPLPVNLLLSLEEVTVINIPPRSSGCPKSMLFQLPFSSSEVLSRGLWGVCLGQNCIAHGVSCLNQKCNFNDNCRNLHSGCTQSSSIIYVLINSFSFHNSLCQISDLAPVHRWGFWALEMLSTAHNISH